MGPLVLMSMFRYESKHRVFKKFANNTNNFKNINKTLAIKHQQHLSTSEYSFTDSFQRTALVTVSTRFIAENKILIDSKWGHKLIHQSKHLQFNSFQYSKDLIIIHNNALYKIRKIIFCENVYSFICEKLLPVKWVNFLNSFKVSADLSGPIIIDLEELQTKKSFELKRIESEYFIIGDTNEIRNVLMEQTL